MKLFKAVLLSLLVAGVVTASTIKVWTNGDALTPADLNAVFAHIHNNMVGGHGARLVDADVSASAAIAQSKISGLTTSLASVPKAWAAMISASCGGAVCAETITAGSGVASISHTGTGTWTVTWTVARSDAFYAVMVSPYNANTINCSPVTLTTTTVDVNCKGTGATVAADSKWMLFMMDNT